MELCIESAALQFFFCAGLLNSLAGRCLCSCYAGVTGCQAGQGRQNGMLSDRIRGSGMNWLVTRGQRMRSHVR